MANKRTGITVDDLDPNVFFQTTDTSGKCLITSNVGGGTGTDHQLFTGPANPNTLPLSVEDGNHAIEVDRSLSASPCVISEWIWDETSSMWVEDCNAEAPVATIHVPVGQMFDDVDIQFGYIPNINCPTPVQSEGAYTILDNNGAVISGPNSGQFAGTLNIDFSTFINPLSSAEYPGDFTFTVQYFVEDNCGTSETVEQTVTVIPYLKEVFTFTGADQNATAPAWSNNAEVKAWGAGGGSDGFSLANIGYGGGGGFTSGNISSQNFIIIVGQGGLQGEGITPYGGGGAATAESSGGGLSGLFRLGGPVTFDATGQSRAILIAGGGGGGAGQIPASSSDGTGGNSAASFSPLQGFSSGLNTGFDGGGGGGYFGGDRDAGGSGFVDTVVTASTLAIGTAGNGGPGIVANNSDFDYIAGVGNAQAVAGGVPANRAGNGLVVITWIL